VGKKVVAVMGAYRKGGILETAVEAILEGVRQRRAATRTIYLADRHIEFCLNCRECTQEPGPERGNCVQHDDLDAILSEIEAADAVVLASPVNIGNTTALFRRFMERLIGCTYWPWGQPVPRARSHVRTLKAALVATSTAPGFLIPWFSEAGKALRLTAKLLGARPVASLYIGIPARPANQKPSERVLTRARRIGSRLV
jgi:NAD(P)H-dependent FMN reductase